MWEYFSEQRAGEKPMWKLLNVCGLKHWAVQCEACCFWHHIKCENFSPSEYVSLGENDEPWICGNCMILRFSDSSFECSSESNISICDHDSSTEPDVDIFDQLSIARMISVCSSKYKQSSLSI